MIVQVSVIAIAYLAVFLIACFLVWYLWRDYSKPGARHFSLLVSAIAFWSLTCIVEASSGDPSIRLLATRLGYVAVTWAGPLWLLFVLDYGYRSRWRVNPKGAALLWALPMVIAVLALTNDYHGLIWYRSQADLIFAGRAPGLWINLIYTYLMMVTGFGLLIWAMIGPSRKNYLKAAVLITGTMIPVASSLLYVLGLDPLIIEEITPFALAATILAYAWSIFGLRLFDVIPVAREALVRSMGDGVIVADRSGYILDMNPAAMRLLGVAESPIGQPLETVLAKWPRLIDACHSDPVEPLEIRLQGAEGLVWMELQSAAVHDSLGKDCGRLLSLRNITKRKLADEEIRRSNESLQAEVSERKQIEAALKQSNESLHAEIKVRRQAEGRLAASLAEKELLLKEIHHRVKNNLQIVSSLLNLQMASSANENATSILRESQNRIKSMALIHEKLYQSKDLARIDFEEYVQTLIASLVRSYALGSAPVIRVDIEDLSMDVGTAIPCGLIINELISNSLKYAFRGRPAGTINVSLCHEGALYRLVVSDDGVGLPPGVDFRNTSTLGLQLVVTLTEQLNGKIEHLPGEGTAFAITFEENCAV